MKQLLLGLLLLILPLPALAQKQSGNVGTLTATTGTPTNCYGANGFVTSASCLVIPNLYGAYGLSLEEIPQGSPSGVSVTVYGCMPNGTCDSVADTNTSTSAAIRGITFTKIYGVWIVLLPTLTGGTGVLVNQVASTANSHAGESSLTLTTTGTSGPATLTGGVLNIPQYSTVYPGAGIANSSGSAWGTSYSSGNTIPANFIASIPTTQLTGTLQAAQEPAHTGDMTNTAGSLATTVKGINGTLLSGLATGLLKNTTTTGVPSIAVASDVYGLFTNCNGSSGFFLKDGGICAAAGSNTRTWSYDFKGVCQAAVASAPVNFPTANAPLYVACSSTQVTPQWSIPAGDTSATCTSVGACTWQFWVRIVPPAGVTSGTSVYTLTSIYNTADTNTGHAATMQPYYACVAAGSSSANPSVSSIGSSQSFAGTASQVDTSVSGTITPTCAAGNTLFILWTFSANTLTSALNFSDVTVSVTGNL